MGGIGKGAGRSVEKSGESRFTLESDRGFGKRVSAVHIGDEIGGFFAFLAASEAGDHVGMLHGFEEGGDGQIPGLAQGVFLFFAFTLLALDVPMILVDGRAKR